MLDEKLAVVYSWHDLHHAFAERNASHGLFWRPTGAAFEPERNGALPAERAARGHGEDVGGS